MADRGEAVLREYEQRAERESDLIDNLNGAEMLRRRDDFLLPVGRGELLRIARDAASILADVARGSEPHRGKMRRTEANVLLIDTLGGLLPTEVVALPIMHGTRAIGILYGDNAEHRTPIDSMTGLEIFLSQAGYAFGNAVFASERAGRR
jgi:hypothetical protein